MVLVKVELVVVMAKTASLISQFLNESLIQYLIEKLLPQDEKTTREQTEECLRFLYLSHLTKGAVPINQKIDDIWHLLILQTKEYFQLCENFPGKTYIHHSSKIYLKYAKEEEPSCLEETKRQLEWLLTYITHFSDMSEVSIKYWSFATALQQKLNLTLEDFNAELRQLIVQE